MGAFMKYDGDERENDRVDERSERERERAKMVAVGQLERRGIHVHGDAHAEVVAELLEAVERFESIVASYGGDSMVNTLDSSDPPRPRFVIPQRHADEGLRRYAARIRAAAERLTGR
jgi:GGDEF domain-containing protein